MRYEKCQGNTYALEGSESCSPCPSECSQKCKVTSGSCDGCEGGYGYDESASDTFIWCTDAAAVSTYLPVNCEITVLIDTLCELLF